MIISNSYSYMYTYTTRYPKKAELSVSTKTWINKGLEYQVDVAVSKSAFCGSPIPPAASWAIRIIHIVTRGTPCGSSHLAQNWTNNGWMSRVCPSHLHLAVPGHTWQAGWQSEHVEIIPVDAGRSRWSARCTNTRKKWSHPQMSTARVLLIPPPPRSCLAVITPLGLKSTRLVNNNSGTVFVISRLYCAHNKM